MALMKLIKSVSKDYVVVGDIVTFTIVASNIGNVVLGNPPNDSIYIYDVLKPELEFISGSVKINGVSTPLGDINSGINLGELQPAQSSTITFDARVAAYTPNKVTNIAEGSYGYTLLGSIGQKNLVKSNEVRISISNAKVDVIKTVDKDFVVLGNTIRYKVKVINSGNIDVSNVLFIDMIPVGTTIVPGSFMVNNNVVNTMKLEQGVNIGNIMVGKTTTIAYEVKVDSPNCSMQLKNSAMVKFTYTLPDGTSNRGESKMTEESIKSVDLGITNFKQMSVEEYLYIPEEKPDVEQINGVTGIIEIVKCSVIETGKITSQEGQKLRGYKLIVHGVLRQIVEYTACEPEQSVHSAHYDIPFSTFIVLPEGYSIGSKIEIEGLVEDIYYNEVNCRLFFTNATILVNAKILGC